MSKLRSRPSMQRLILGYAPANLVPAAVSIASIAVFTRLLTPQAFGRYSLAFSLLMVAQTVLFFAPTLAVTRFHAVAEGGRTRETFLKAMYGVMALAGLLAIAIWLGARHLPAAGELLRQLGDTAWLIVPVLLLRALVAANQTVNRAAGDMLRFNLIECLHAVIGLLAGVALVGLGLRSGAAIMGGLLVGAVICAAIDARRLLVLRAAGRIDRALLRDVWHFVWPLVLAYAVGAALQYADRFVVDLYAGSAALGVYVVAFSLVDRPISLICLSVTAGTFQLAVDTYVRDGAEAGRRQAGHNGAVLLGLALPACVGLMLASRSIAAVMVGPAFRDGIVALVPIMAATSLLRGVGAHYVDHAFHLANRSFRLFAVYTPSAVGNILLSLLLVPRYGMVAAAYAALACQAAALLAGWWAARRVLPLWLPGRDMLKILACLAAMTLVLALLRLPVGGIGLAGTVGLGVAAYAGSALALDLGGLRRLLRRRAVARPPAPAWPS